MLRAVAPTIDDPEDLDRFLGDLVNDDIELVDDDFSGPWHTALVPSERMSSQQVAGLANPCRDPSPPLAADTERCTGGSL